VVPTTFVGLALFVAFITPGYMWVRVEERARPRPDRSQLLEVAELLVIGAFASLLSAALVAVLGSHLRPLLNTAAWVGASEPSAYLQAHAMRGLASLVLTVLLANGGAHGAASWWFGRTGRSQRARLSAWTRERLGLTAPPPQRIQTAHSPWYDVFGSIDKERHVAVLTVLQDDGAVVTGLLRSYDASAAGDEQDLALQRPIKLQRPGGVLTELRDDFVVLPARTIRAVLITLKKAAAS
jgi:hypothetical protein